MIRSLRKGTTTVEIWHEAAEDSINLNAEETEVELKSDYAVFRTTLKPCDGNQKDDADGLFFNESIAFKHLSFQDPKIRESTAKFLNAYKSRIKYIQLEVIYKKRYQFDVGLKSLDEDSLLFEIKA